MKSAAARRHQTSGSVRMNFDMRNLTDYHYRDFDVLTGWSGFAFDTYGSLFCPGFAILSFGIPWMKIFFRCSCGH